MTEHDLNKKSTVSKIQKFMKIQIPYLYYNVKKYDVIMAYDNEKKEVYDLRDGCKV